MRTQIVFEIDYSVSQKHVKAELDGMDGYPGEIKNTYGAINLYICKSFAYMRDGIGTVPQKVGENCFQMVIKWRLKMFPNDPCIIMQYFRILFENSVGKTLIVDENKTVQILQIN